MQQAQKLEAIGRAVGGVAHDFNNLLTVILSANEFMIDRVAHHEDLLRDAQMVQDAAERARALTSQLLSFTGRGSRAPEAIDVGETLASAERLLPPLLRDDVKLEVRWPTDLGQIASSAGELEQAVINLCINANDAIEGAGHVWVTASNQATPEGERVVVEVRDDGVGMPPDVVEKALEPFFTTKAHGRGTGLGLAIVHGVVERAHGTLGIRSTPGQGTTIRMAFPRAGGLQGAQTRGDQRSATILVVDDQPAVAEAVARALRRSGHDVLTAFRGVDALATLVSNPAIEVMVTDLAMPGMSGMELAEEAERRWPKLGVVFMSGYRGQFTSTGWSPGDRPLIDKPPTAAELDAAIRRVLDQEPVLA